MEPLRLEDVPLEEVNKTAEDVVKRGSVLHNNDGELSRPN